MKTEITNEYLAEVIKKLVIVADTSVIARILGYTDCLTAVGNAENQHPRDEPQRSAESVAL